MDLGLYDLDYNKHSLDRAVRSGEDRSIPKSSSSVCVFRLVHKNPCFYDRKASLPLSELTDLCSINVNCHRTCDSENASRTFRFSVEEQKE